ncbi:MAG: hypothetical protein U0794_05865 [Isosphaeraceae bacterium]
MEGGSGSCLDADGGWTEAQFTLAFNLLGIPSELRGADPWTTVGLDSPRALVDRELARLDDATRGRLEMLDREERALASKANPVVIPPALARVARQEATLLRRLQWVRAELDELAEPAQVNPPPLDDPFLDDDEDDEDDDPELPPSPPARTPVRSQIPLDPIERDPIRPAPVYEGATSGGLVEALEPEFRPRNRRERLAARKLDRRDSRR